MSATLTARAAPEYGPRWREVMVDCEHGTSSATWRNGDSGPSVTLGDAMMARMALATHYEAERCACTKALRRRYGVN